MQLNVVKNEVISLSIRETNEEINLKTDQSRLDLGFAVEFFKESYSIIFNIKLIFDDNKELNLLYKTIFQTSIEIDDKFKDSKFPYVNSPSIAFPFLRAFIPNITMMSGYSVVMLPSINFIKMYEEKEKEIVRINHNSKK